MLRAFFIRVFSILGINKAIAFTLTSSVISAFGNFFTLIFILKYLNQIEQGYYYTFGSIVAIQVFFELGLNGVITQFVAHENSFLNENESEGEGIHSGNVKYKSRLSSLLHFSIKWYLTFSVLLIILLILVGYFFFTSYQIENKDINWSLPWILLAIGTGANLILSPIVAYLQGLGEVKEIAKFIVIQQVIKLGISWTGLILGFKLYVLGIASLFGFIILSLLILSNYLKQIKSIWEFEIVEKISYKNEIFPYQWKIGLSWISGYFIFQLFNPILFATEGPIVSGQMGITLTVLNGILSLSFAWITTKIPIFSSLIAQKKYTQLDSVFKKTLIQSTLINLTCLIIIYLFIVMSRKINLTINGKLIGDRFLNYFPLFFMMTTFLINHIVGSLATYLRCHKKEPFLIMSIVAAVLCSLSTIYFGKRYGVIGITSGYFIITVLLFPWAIYIFFSKRNSWHHT